MLTIQSWDQTPKVKGIVPKKTIFTLKGRHWFRDPQTTHTYDEQPTNLENSQEPPQNLLEQLTELRKALYSLVQFYYKKKKLDLDKWRDT